jgi:hypothetical protein
VQNLIYLINELNLRWFKLKFHSFIERKVKNWGKQYIYILLIIIIILIFWCFAYSPFNFFEEIKIKFRIKNRESNIWSIHLWSIDRSPNLLNLLFYLFFILLYSRRGNILYLIQNKINSITILTSHSITLLHKAMLIQGHKFNQ